VVLLHALIGAASAREAMCPTSVAFSNSTRITSADPVKRFNEISGLVMSPKIRGPSKEPILYGINDGGGGNRLGVWDSATGERLLTFRIPSSVISNIDWETIAIGSCGVTGESKTCIYIGDTGDNRARVASGRKSRRGSRTSYRLLKIKEPNYKVRVLLDVVCE
jgi:hypothetical protein